MQNKKHTGTSTLLENSWYVVDIEREGRMQVRQLHRDACPTLDSGISSAAVATLHSK